MDISITNESFAMSTNCVTPVLIKMEMNLLQENKFMERSKFRHQNTAHLVKILTESIAENSLLIEINNFW